MEAQAQIWLMILQKTVDDALKKAQEQQKLKTEKENRLDEEQKEKKNRNAQIAMSDTSDVSKMSDESGLK